MIEYNECQPIVLFPLGIACQTTNPTSATTSDGVASLIITGGTPPYTITWSPILWPGGTPPTPSATAGAVDVYSIFTINGGTTWFGFEGGLNFL